MKKLFTLAAIGMLASGSAFSQVKVTCGTDEYFSSQKAMNPSMLVAQRKFDDSWVKNMDELQRAQRAGEDTQLYIIPVVVHLIHYNGAEKLALNRVRATIDGLNGAFRKTNADASRVRPIFKDMATDARIEFRLATKDEMGRCTNGVTETVSQLTISATDAVKSLIQWDPSKYLNIWVVRGINSDAVKDGTIAGYSQFPWMGHATPYNDGIVMDYKFMTATDRTLTHEVGHYLGLYHPFQDGCSVDQRLQGDKLEDTPPVKEASFVANATSNTCHTDVPDQLDMWENYMDYNDRKYLFTPQQVIRMRSSLTGFRSTLVTPWNLKYTVGSCAFNSGINGQEYDLTALSMYPNPATESLTLKFNSPKATQLNITVADATGKLVGNVINVPVNYGVNMLNYNLSDLGISANGVYLVKLASPSGAQTLRLTVVK